MVSNMIEMRMSASMASRPFAQTNSTENPSLQPSMFLSLEPALNKLA